MSSYELFENECCQSHTLCIGMNEILRVFFTFFVALDMMRYMRCPKNYWIVIVSFQVFHIYSPILSELCIRDLHIRLLSTCEFRKSLQGRPYCSCGHKQNYICLCTVQPYEFVLLLWYVGPTYHRRRTTPRLPHDDTLPRQKTPATPEQHIVLIP